MENFGKRIKLSSPPLPSSSSEESLVDLTVGSSSSASLEEPPSAGNNSSSPIELTSYSPPSSPYLGRFDITRVRRALYFIQFIFRIELLFTRQ